MRISALLSAGTARRCIHLIESSGHSVLVFSRLLDELVEVLKRKSLIPAADQQTLLTDIHERAELVEPDQTIIGVCRDPDDDIVFGCAVAGHADLILSGDADLLSMRSFRDIRILSPREFLNEFGSPAISNTQLP